MRIAIVAPLVTPIVEPQLGGSQAICADLARGLTERGHDVAVFASSTSDIDGVRVVDTGVDHTTLASALFRADGDGEEATGEVRKAFATAYACVSEDTWDVIHNHAFDVPAIDLAPDDVPVVHTLHLPPSAAIAAALRRRPATVACVSEWSASAWRASTRVDAVLRNGVPVDRIGFDERGGDGVLFAGRLSPEKGAAEAIEIATAAGLEITVVGDPYDPVYARDVIEPLRRRPAVTVIDAVSRERVWERMGRSCAVLCPALWDEPFGLVAAEAQAAGTPVVAFARGALPEVVRDGETGSLVSDVPGAVAALGHIGRIDRRACRDHAETNLSLDATLDAHEVLYGAITRVSTR